MSYQLNDPRSRRPLLRACFRIEGSDLVTGDPQGFGALVVHQRGGDSVHRSMGSLVKKRRKRMRKKKHRKMLRRTRYQRRNR